MRNNSLINLAKDPNDDLDKRFARIFKVAVGGFGCFTIISMLFSLGFIGMLFWTLGHYVIKCW